MRSFRLPAFLFPIQIPCCQHARTHIPALSIHPCSVVNSGNAAKGGQYAVVQAAVADLGYTLKNSSVGPLVRLALSDTKDSDNLASLSGAILPNKRLHVESYRAFASTTSTTLLKLTPAMMVFLAALAVASDRGAQHVYGLAIEDDAEQHRRLVAYLVRFGGHQVHRVDDSLRSVPARILYGGFGTVIRGDIASMLNRGIAMIKRQTKFTA